MLKAQVVWLNARRGKPDMASDAPAQEGTFAQVVEAAIAAGLAAALPVLAEAGVACIDDIRRGPVLDGVAPEHLMQIVLASQGTEPASQSQLATQQWPPRPDAAPGCQSVVLGRTGGGAAGQQEKGPHGPSCTWETVRCIGASLKAGNYRSAQNYFDDAFRHQEVHLQLGGRPLVTATGPAGGQVNRQRALG